MTIISGYAQLMAAADESETREKYVEQIQRQFDLMAGMTREVLAFARGDTDLVVRKVYMNKFAEDLTTQLGAAGPCTVRNLSEPSGSTSAIDPAPPPSTAIACARMRSAASRSSTSAAPRAMAMARGAMTISSCSC